MVGMMAQAQCRNVQRKWLDGDGLQSTQSREHPGYAMVEHMDLAWSNAVRVSVQEMVW